MREIVRPQEQLTDGALHLENFTCSYSPKGLFAALSGKKTDVISGLNLEVEPKGVLAVLGQSGRGKTTFLRALGMSMHYEHSSQIPKTNLSVTGKFNGEPIKKLSEIGAYAKTHFELQDEPLRAKGTADIRAFVDSLSRPDKRSKGLIFATHYMSPELLETVDKIFFMDEPRMVVTIDDDRIIPRLEKYFENAAALAKQEGKIKDITEGEEQKQHVDGANRLVTLFDGAIKGGLIAEDTVRNAYNVHEESFRNVGKVRMWVPSLCFGRARQKIWATLRGEN